MARDDRVITAVKNAMPWLEEESQWWIEEKKCVSCHHTTFSVWARELAVANGVELDQSKLADDRRWVLEEFVADREADPENPKDTVKEGELNGDRNVEGVSQYLLSPAGDYLEAKERKQLQEIIKRNKLNDGSWKPGGQLPMQKRPAEETTAISGMWARLALDQKRSNTESEPSSMVSTEWYVMSLIAGIEAKKDEEVLLKRQNKDGGWSWKDGEASSPTATGQALWALSFAKDEAQARAAIERGQLWLLNNQREDGIWKTQSTKRREKSNRISNFWGTSWAVIGLLESQK